MKPINETAKTISTVLASVAKLEKDASRDASLQQKQRLVILKLLASEIQRIAQEREVQDVESVLKLAFVSLGETLKDPPKDPVFHDEPDDE